MSYLNLIRPEQYVKNLFVLAPLFFVGRIFDADLLVQGLLAMAAFCLVSSAVYILNDWLDADSDRQHPVKKSRPLAAGTINLNAALMLLLVCLISGLALAWQVSAQVTLVLCAYVVLNVLYSFHLKHVALLDVSIIAIGFVLRLFAGAFATGVELSAWIVIMTYLLALFLALAKRRDDILIYQQTGIKPRKVVDGYNLQFLDISIAIMASVIIVCYVVYTTAVGEFSISQSSWLYLTTVFVVLGILRYLQLTLVMNDSGSPTRVLLRDRVIQLVVVSWVIAFLLALY